MYILTFLCFVSLRKIACFHPCVGTLEETKVMLASMYRPGPVCMKAG